MYRLASRRRQGVDRDAVGKLWDPVENGLRDLAVQLCRASAGASRVRGGRSKLS